MAHVGLVQCGQEAVNTGQGEQESEMLLIDRNTHDSIRQMALDMLQRSKEGLLHAKRTQEVTKSLVEAFDKPPAAKLILPRLRNSTPSLSSTFVDQSPPPPPQADAQHIHPAQQSSGQQQPHQPQQPLNSPSGQAGCRPDAPPGGRRNPDNGDGGDGSFGTHFRGGSPNFRSSPTGIKPDQHSRATTRRSGSSRNRGVQHQKDHQQEEYRQEENQQVECQQEEYQREEYQQEGYQQEEYRHNRDSDNEEEEIDEWTKGDWAWVEGIIPEDGGKEKRPSGDPGPLSEWSLADWDMLEDIIPGKNPTQKCGHHHATVATSPREMYQTPIYESLYSLLECDQSDCSGEMPQGRAAIPHPLLIPPLQGGQEESPSKDTSDENDRGPGNPSHDRHQRHQRSFLPVSLPTQSQWVQSQFTTFTHAMRRIAARSQLQQEATSVTTEGDHSEGDDIEDFSGTDPRRVAATPPATQTTQAGTPDEQAPTEEVKIVEPETSPIPAVPPEDARGRWDPLLGSPPYSAAAEGKWGGGEVEENKQKVEEEEYKKVYQELQRMLSNVCESLLRPLGVSEDSLRSLQSKDGVSFGEHRSSFSPLISERAAQEDNSVSRLLAALDRGQSLQAEIAAEIAATGGRLSGGLLMKYVDFAREICQPHDDSSRKIDELCARAEIALRSSSSATATATAEQYDN